MNELMGIVKRELYGSLFVLLFIAYIFLQAGEIKGTSFLIFYVLIRIFLKYAGFYSKNIVDGFFFTVAFFWVGHNEYNDLFGDQPYVLLLFMIMTVLLGLYIVQQGLLYDGIERRGANKCLRFLAVSVMTVMFFGFQTGYIGIKYGRWTGILLFVIFFWWVDTFYRTVVWIGKKIIRWTATWNKGEEVGKHTLRVWVEIFFIIAAISFLCSLLYYPGIVSPDTFANYQAAVKFDNIDLRSDLHSFGYILLTRLILTISQKYYILTLFMILSFAAVWACYMSYLYKKGIREYVVVLASFFWILIPSNLYLSFNTWKDIPFAICMLLSSLMLTQAVLEPGFKSDYRRLAIFIMSLVGTAIFRSNGQVVLLGMVLILCMSAVRKVMDKKIALSAITACVLVLLFKGPVFQALQVQPSLEGFASIPFIDGIWENVHHGEYINDEIIDFIEDELMPMDEFTSNYAQNYTNIYAFKDGYGNIDFSRAQNAYLWCLKEHPVTTILARFKRTYNIWSVFPDETYWVGKNYYGKLRNWMEIDPEISEGLEYNPRLEPLRQRFQVWYSDDYFIGSIQFFLSRCGWNMVLWIIAFVELIRKKNGIRFMPIVPAFMNVIGLFVGCCFPEIRYFYPMFLLSVPFYLTFLIPEGDL